MYEFRMPSLGADMEAGTLSRWLVAPGDRVERGDIVAVVETVKSDIEVEIFHGGVVEELLVREGREVPVGTPLARLRTEVAEPGEAAEPAPPEAGPPAPAPPLPGAPAPVRAPPAAVRVHASPVARKMATALGVDLATVEGTGAGGAILKADVERAAQAPREEQAARPERPKRREEVAAPPAPSPAAERAAGMRRAIAAAMARSKREIPHYYLASTIDLSRSLGWLERENLARPVTERLLPAALLLRASALALHEVPELNGFWQDDAFRPGPGVHLGVGISLRGGGLVAPALHDADRKSLAELMTALRDLVQRARAGRLRSSELTDATITVTNLGERGVETVFGIIYPPQVALVGFGTIVERPWAEGGMVGARPTVTATLAADHRASDGHRGALFLAALDRLLQEPEAL